MKTTNELLNIFSQKQNEVHLLNKKFKEFEKNLIPELTSLKNKLSQGNANVFQMMNANTLSSANAITRTFSTKLGLFLEEITILSKNVICPEKELKYKIPGVDIIVQYDNKLYYTQLKTQKNTLTGSQGSRVVSELSKFENSWFVACLNNDASWTAPAALNRLVGDEFWSKIGISYQQILDNLKIIVEKVNDLL